MMRVSWPEAPFWQRWGGLLITLAMLMGIELLRRWVVPILHPAALLQAAVVFSAFMGGLRGGLTSAALVVVYSFWFYALPGALFRYADQDVLRLGSVLLQTPIMALLVGLLHHRMTQRVVRLEESDARLHGVMEAILDGIIIVDERGIVESVNPAAARIFGYDPDEVVGRNVSLLMPEPYRREHDSNIRRYLRSGVPHIIGIGREVIGRRKNGADFPMDLAVSELWAAGRRLFVGVQRDITERKQAELQLQFQRTLLECQSEAAPDGILAVSSEREWLYVNRRFIEMWDIPEEVVARRSSDAALQAVLDKVEEPEQFAERIRQLYAQSDEQSRDVVRLKDGRTFERFSAPVKTADGHYFGRVWYYHDITDATRAEAALRESEERYRLLADNSTDLISRHAPNGTILFVSQASQKLLGFAPEELVGVRPRQYLHPDDVDLLRQSSAAAVLGEPFTVIYRMRRKDGDYVWVEVTSRAVLDPATGQAHEYVAVTRDITERRQADERLRRTMTQLEEQYRQAERARGEVRAVLDAAGEAIVLIAPDRRVLWINSQFAEFFEVRPEQVVGRSLDEHGPLSDRMFAGAEGILARLVRSLSDPEVKFSEIISQRWPQQRELELYSTPVHTDDGEHLGRLFVFRDVTREREVDRMKSEFVSLVSHELRTPLTSIKGYVDLLMDGEVGEITEDQSEFLSIVKNNADRLVALINDLLDISRIESGRIELNLTSVDLERLAANVATSLRPQIEVRGQHLVLDLPDHLPAVRGDADRVAQILFNLLSNAYKYTPPGGRIALVAQAEEGRVRVTVQDSGIGMTPEEQAQLFTRFFRARNRTTQEVSGTGLGLAITRSLVELHGGEIRVQSAPGLGSIFSFTLPLVGEEPPVSPAPERGQPERPAPLPGGRVLVVDDEPDIAGLIGRYLERGGYQVLVARDGAEALRLARAERPDLITLDLVLPDADGFTVLEWLKEDPATAAIPVVMLSIVADNGKGKLLGAVDYLTKPVTETVLLERVRQILNGGRGRRILVADDDPDVLRLVAGQLRRAGYEVIEASDGIEAAALARRSPVDLALLDIRMPGLDGIGVLSDLRADPATRGLPVVMMTASPGAFEQSRPLVESLGGAFLLSKPMTAEELASAIARGLAARQPP